MKKKWKKPLLKKIIIDIRCNPAIPQWVFCLGQRPQESTRCRRQKIGLS